MMSAHGSSGFNCFRSARGARPGRRRGADGPCRAFARNASPHGPAHSLERGLVKPPLFVQTIFGILGGIGADPENLVHMRRIADKLFGDGYHWSILAAGRHAMALCTRGVTMGANARVGLEDSIYVGKGQLAKSNAEQVAKIRTILEALSLEVATPAEARSMLALKNGDQVAF